MSAKNEVIIVDTVPLVVSLLDDMVDLPNDPPSLYMDLEGIRLGRNGTISIFSLYVYPKKTAYLIDVHKLEGAAFTTAGGNGATLKSILESSTIPKVMFDLRSDSDALRNFP
jgi:exonuclease 3'-5' domain-containing protein 1